jgi:hypothetical protein
MTISSFFASRLRRRHYIRSAATSGDDESETRKRVTCGDGGSRLQTVRQTIATLAGTMGRAKERAQ